VAEINNAVRLPQGGRPWAVWVIANAVAGGIVGAAVAIAGIPAIALFGLVGGALQWRALQQYDRVTALWALATALAGVAAWIAVVLYFNIAQLLFFLVGLILSFPVHLLAPLARAFGVDLVTAATPVLLYLTFRLLAGIGGAIAGAIVGAIQAPILRRYSRVATSWLLASTLGCALAGAVAGDNIYWQAQGRTLSLGTTASTPELLALAENIAITGVVFGILYGIVTGVELARRLTPSAPAT
jgi:hypothetical protein